MIRKMKKSITLFFLWTFHCTVCPAQRTIQTDQFQMTVEELAVYDQNISFSAPESNESTFAIRLFKQYYNPPSFEAYRAFFLTSDWGGFSKADFDKWQLYIHSNQLILNKTMRLHDQNGNAFIICQYTLETPQYEIPGTAIFKNINQSWKHISFMNDPQAYDLEHIGLLSNEAVTALSENGVSQRLRSIPAENMYTPKEKFDRRRLFVAVKSTLQAKGVSMQDIAIAETMFVGRNEVDMVKYLGETYPLDPYDLMEEMNKLFGFSLFKFANTLKSN